MWACICVYVRMQNIVCTFWACESAHTHTRKHANTRTHAHTHARTHIRARTHARTHTHTRKHTHTHLPYLERPPSPINPGRLSAALYRHVQPEWPRLVKKRGPNSAGSTACLCLLDVIKSFEARIWHAQKRSLVVDRGPTTCAVERRPPCAVRCKLSGNVACCFFHVCKRFCCGVCAGGRGCRVHPGCGLHVADRHDVLVRRSAVHDGAVVRPSRSVACQVLRAQLHCGCRRRAHSRGVGEKFCWEDPVQSGFGFLVDQRGCSPCFTARAVDFDHACFPDGRRPHLECNRTDSGGHRANHRALMQRLHHASVHDCASQRNFYVGDWQPRRVPARPHVSTANLEPKGTAIVSIKLHRNSMQAITKPSASLPAPRPGCSRGVPAPVHVVTGKERAPIHFQRRCRRRRRPFLLRDAGSSDNTRQHCGKEHLGQGSLIWARGFGDKSKSPTSILYLLKRYYSAPLLSINNMKLLQAER